MKNYHLVISAPQGPTISDMYHYKEKILYPLYYANKFNIPYIIIGVSMGPFNKKSNNETEVLSILKGAKKIIVREDISLDFVKQKYPTLNNISSAIDLVFATDNDIASKSVTLQNNYSSFVSNVGKNSIGACISLTPPRKPDSYFDKELYISKMALFFEYVINVTNKNIILFPHLKFDMSYLQKIKIITKHSNQITIFPECLDSDFQQHMITHNLEFFISSRYHPTIFAIKGETPFMCIKNQFKTEGMLLTLGLDFPTCWQDDSSAIFQDVFHKCWSKRFYYTSEIKKAHQLAKNRASLYKTSLNKLLITPPE